MTPFHNENNPNYEKSNKPDAIDASGFLHVVLFRRIFPAYFLMYLHNIFDYKQPY